MEGLRGSPVWSGPATAPALTDICFYSGRTPQCLIKHVIMPPRVSPATCAGQTCFRLSDVSLSAILHEDAKRRGRRSG